MEAMAWLIFRGYFYPRPPRGGRRGKKMVGVASNKFLSTPSARRATCGRIRLHAVVEFLSTPSARRATEKDELLNFHLVISIHALREEGDIRPASWPCGMRRFLSTPSARRATLMS